VRQINVDENVIELIEGSGDAALDGSLDLLAHDLVRALAFKRSEFPSLFFFDDGSAPNCIQVDDPEPMTPILPGTRGSVVLGRSITRSLLDSPKLRYLRGAALTGVVAHEFAHAYQRVNGYFDRLYGVDPKFDGTAPVRVLELHADFLAGYYMGQQEAFTSRAFLDFSEALLALGDIAFNNPTHHGTPTERAVCMYRGRNLAEIGGVSIHAAAEQAEQFVLGLSRG